MKHAERCRRLLKKPVNYRFLLLLLALEMILLGVLLLGEQKIVQTNAHWICLECLGIS